MGYYAFASGALVMAALMTFVDTIVTLESLPFVYVVPFLLALVGFFSVSLVDPFMLGSAGAAANPFASSATDGMLVVRHRGTFVIGIGLMMISTAIALTMNGIGGGTTGCAHDSSGSSWPGFSLVLQTWLILAGATALFLDKCQLKTSGSGGFSILHGGDSEGE